MSGEKNDMEDIVVDRLGLRPQGEGYSIEQGPDERLLCEQERTAMARFHMLKDNGHRCFCTTLDVPGMGRPCCVTGFTLPISDRATFEACGGDMLSGEPRPRSK